MACLIAAGPAVAQDRPLPETFTDRLFGAFDEMVAKHVDRPTYGRLATAAFKGALAANHRQVLIRLPAKSLDREHVRQATVRVVGDLLISAHSSPAHPDLSALISAALADLGPANSYRPDANPVTPPTLGSIGIELTVRGGEVVVVTTLPDRPAERAGLKPNDVFIELSSRERDDALWVRHDLSALSLASVMGALRGPVGSSVRVTVRRPGHAEPLQLQIAREVVGPASVSRRTLGDGLGYIRIMSFNSDTADKIRDAVAMLASAGALRGLVMDLRSNQGGLVEQAVKTADLFLDSGVIARQTGRNQGDHVVHEATPGDIVTAVPIAVLVDARTAAGAELLARALQVHGRAKIVGSRTYGHGAITTAIGLTPPAVMMIQTGRWTDRNSRSWDGKGIDPTELVNPDPSSPGSDATLTRALAVLAASR